ncbi:uncharacterized protein DFL_000022 [Arthrobotrys flagrans]|uniref:Ubiquitin 3 binding protein But2 C-terminal domain-containing protein n=1 Tax=Arthrobotrys flagrans TaxID=97331 RepID=A0A437AD24_ARTFL|nr:hypothetical protein DFL_000022 [Arthrobotrys flagrans]
MISSTLLSLLALSTVACAATVELKGFIGIKPQNEALGGYYVGYGGIRFRIMKNTKPLKFDGEDITEYVILPPVEQIPMTAPGQPKFHMCVKKSDFENCSGDAEFEGKVNPAHWGYSGSTLNLDDLQPGSVYEPVDVYLLGYQEPHNKKVKLSILVHETGSIARG